MPVDTPKPETEPITPKVSRRQKRADALRKRALSPVRILIMVLMLPLTILSIVVAVFLRTSGYEREEALIHLIALAGCDAVETIVPGPFLAGGPGYHPRNDPDGDGVACETLSGTPVSGAVPQRTGTRPSRTVGTAKFVRP
ncbi:excalibur calcium-binding domain-containing protein [Ruegeria arenilitoris]|uniref:excalibur calcium-binding domain-containing protein n=1 Tax=Ruegeria arenilitoris TaxID=1173585 RepID=UPI00147BDCE7|nr:excalibur calcium-binding domain-containing protein [Ruegeria arenilitoris]